MPQSNQIKGRLTSKKFIDWINAEFERFEIKNYVVTEVERTRFRSQDYEAWAAKLYVRFDLKDESKRKWHTKGTMLCFYSLREYGQYLKNGYKMYLKFRGQNCILTDLEVDLRR